MTCEWLRHTRLFFGSFISADLRLSCFRIICSLYFSVGENSFARRRKKIVKKNWKNFVFGDHVKLNYIHSHYLRFSGVTRYKLFHPRALSLHLWPRLCRLQYDVAKVSLNRSQVKNHKSNVRHNFCFQSFDGGNGRWCVAGSSRIDWYIDWYRKWNHIIRVRDSLDWAHWTVSNSIDSMISKTHR